MPDAEASTGARRMEVGARCISLTIRGALYGLTMDDVQEVIAVPPMTRVFHGPRAMAGVVSLRGEILPVLDLAVLLGAEDPSPTESRDARVVVIRETDGPSRRAGVLVDTLGGIRDIPSEGLEPIPTTAIGPVGDFLAGIIASPPPCSVLSVRRILDAPQIAGLAERKDRVEETAG